VVAINRVGSENFEGVTSYPYYGSSYVAGPDGRTPVSLNVYIFANFTNIFLGTFT
jgi:hypothetical protein